MKASNVCIDAIKSFEGFRSKAYKCPAGVWTCGHGTTKNITPKTTCSKQQAEQWLREDIEPIENYLNKINICTTQGQFDALTDFIYNLGIGNFSKSTLLKYILAKRPTEQILNQFMRWVYAGGKKLKGLVKRREWECQTWIK